MRLYLLQRDVDDNSEIYTVVEADRLGQFYRTNGRHEYPDYCWSLKKLGEFSTARAANAFISGLSYREGGNGSLSLRHPTITSSGGVGGGRYDLDPDGGDLLFTIVNPPV